MNSIRPAVLCHFFIEDVMNIPFRPLQGTFAAFIALKYKEGFTLGDALRARCIQWISTTRCFKKLKNIFLKLLLSRGDLQVLQTEGVCYRLMTKLQRQYVVLCECPSFKTYQETAQTFEELHRLGSENGIPSDTLNGLIRRHVGHNVGHHLLRWFAEDALTDERGLSATKLITFFQGLETRVRDRSKRGYGEGAVIRDLWVNLFQKLLKSNPRNCTVLLQACQYLQSKPTPELLHRALYSVFEEHERNHGLRTSWNPHSLEEKREVHMRCIQQLIPEGMIEDVRELSQLQHTLKSLEAELDRARGEQRELGDTLFSFTSGQIQAIFGEAIPDDTREAMEQDRAKLVKLEEDLQELERVYQERYALKQSVSFDLDENTIMRRMRLAEVTKQIHRWRHRLEDNTLSPEEIDTIQTKIRGAESTKAELEEVDSVQETREHDLSFQSYKEFLDSVKVLQSQQQLLRRATYPLSMARIMPNTLTFTMLFQHPDRTRIIEMSKRYQTLCTAIMEIEEGLHRCQERVLRLQSRLEYDPKTNHFLCASRHDIVTAVAEQQVHLQRVITQFCSQTCFTQGDALSKK